MTTTADTLTCWQMREAALRAERHGERDFAPGVPVFNNSVDMSDYRATEPGRVAENILLAAFNMLAAGKWQIAQHIELNYERVPGGWNDSDLASVREMLAPAPRNFDVSVVTNRIIVRWG
jgi:hypothetical protein